MGQFILCFSKKMRKKNSHVLSVDSAQRQCADCIQSQHGKRVDSLNVTQVENLVGRREHEKETCYNNYY